MTAPRSRARKGESAAPTLTTIEITMAKYPDKRKAQSDATICRYRHDEDAAARHARRFETAQSHAHLASEWAAARGVSFVIRNHGHHWTFTLPDEWSNAHFAQWWPQSAKLVFWNQWADGVHAHDVPQLVAELERVLGNENCREQNQRRVDAKRAAERKRGKRNKRNRRRSTQVSE